MATDSATYVDLVRDTLESVTNVKKESLVYEYFGEPPPLDPPDPSVDIDAASKPLIARVIGPKGRRATFTRFLDEGYRGIIAHDGDELIAHGWIRLPSSAVVIDAVPSCIADLGVYWLTHGRTAKAYRNRGWHTEMLSRRLQWIYEHDPNASVYTDATVDNVSRRTFVSTGFVPCGRICTYRIGHPSIAVKRFESWDPGAEHPPIPTSH